MGKRNATVFLVVYFPVALNSSVKITVYYTPIKKLFYINTATYTAEISKLQ